MDASHAIDEVHEERTYEVLTYDILLEQAGFKSFKLYADFEDKKPRKKIKPLVLCVPEVSKQVKNKRSFHDGYWYYCGI